jgi:hypothetical protein
MVYPEKSCKSCPKVYRRLTDIPIDIDLVEIILHVMLVVCYGHVEIYSGFYPCPDRAC